MKNLTKIGILAFIFSIIIIYMSSLNFQGAITGSTLQQAILSAQNTTSVLLVLPNSTAFGMAYYTDGNAVNFALTNESGLAAALSEINSSSKWSAQSTGSSYILEMSYNSTYGIFPYQMQKGAHLVHYSAQSPILPAGNYYAVFHNPGNSSITVSYSTVLKSESQINSMFISNAAYGALAMLLFFGGLLVIFYSIFIKKSAEPEDTLENTAAKEPTLRKGHPRVKASRTAKRKSKSATGR